MGGVLVGQDLIKAAEVQAQIGQIEKYKTAVNTFRLKYGYLPGDIPATYASQFGLTSRGGWAGEGDNSGTIQGECSVQACNCGFCSITGEASLFWTDLANSGLIEGTYIFTHTNIGTTIDVSSIYKYIPSAKMGFSNFVYVWSGGQSGGWLNAGDGNNYFGISQVNSIGGGVGWQLNSIPGMTVSQAYSIDKKIDNGLPQSGNVMAWYINYNLQRYSPTWASGGGIEGNPHTTATPGNSTTCYDNNNSAANPVTYSLPNGNSLNCSLSFKFQ